MADPLFLSLSLCVCVCVYVCVVKVGKCKALVLVPNVEMGVSALAETARQIAKACLDKGVRIVFALSRAKLGALVKRGVRISMCR